MASIISEVSGLKVEEQFTVISNPEFLREGYALEDVFFPDRVVVGTTNDKARAVLRKLYHKLVNRIGYEAVFRDFMPNFNPNERQTVYFETDLKSAEMIKICLQCISGR
ncbi:hypothetical protein [Paenibacillus lautus]|uniref:hypothetical protein n=1 Tax=Paenibacillus lautus TaxID=1401 RepID=UPI003D26E0F0